MTTPLERVARAICAAADGDPDWVTRNSLWRGDTPPCAWETYLEAAKAALQALRQVDDETVEAMFKRWRSGPDHTVRDAQRSCFTAAIDHILSQTPNQGSER